MLIQQSQWGKKLIFLTKFLKPKYQSRKSQFEFFFLFLIHARIYQEDPCIVKRRLFGGSDSKVLVDAGLEQIKVIGNEKEGDRKKVPVPGGHRGDV